MAPLLDRPTPGASPLASFLEEGLQALLLGRTVWWLARRRPLLHRTLNRFLINRAVNVVGPRPYRLSTKSDFTSWDGLTDKRYNTRELPPTTDEHPGAPKPEDVLELFRRGEMIECEKSTVMFAYFAQWFTDGFLRSDRSAVDDTGAIAEPRDITRNESTHEVDLAQLYGLTPDVTEMLRDPDDRALLAHQLDDNGEEYPPDLFEADGRRVERFAQLRMIGISPRDPQVVTKPGLQPGDLLAMGSDASNTQIGYAMLNTLFLREHNRIAREVRDSQKAIGEPWSDDRVFAAARGVLTVLLIKLAIEEYINHITPYHFRFRFDRSGFHKQPWHRPNWMAVEFNLLYRWHSLIPSQLELDGTRVELSETMFRSKSLLMGHGLGRLLEDASSQHAGALGLYNTGPELLWTAELPSIRAGRTVRLRGYNDYRSHCKLPRARTFEAISSRPRVAEALRTLYAGNVDAVEFYVGLFAENGRDNAVTPPLMGRLVASHAFSQLMTNPLLAPAVYSEETFSGHGMRIIEETGSLEQVVARNVRRRPGRHRVTLTHPDWKRR